MGRWLFTHSVQATRASRCPWSCIYILIFIFMTFSKAHRSFFLYNLNINNTIDVTKLHPWNLSWASSTSSYTGNVLCKIYFKHYSLNPLSFKMPYFELFSHHNSLWNSCSPICVLCLVWYAKVITVWRDQIIWPHLVTHHCYIVMRNVYTCSLC